MLTYNVNWGQDEDFRSNPKKTLEAIKKINADVLVLQEITAVWEKNLKAQFKNRYPYQLYQLTENGGGKAILSKFPIVKSLQIPSKFKWYPLLIAYIKSNIGLIQVVDVHLTPTFLPHAVNGIQKISAFEAPNRRLQEMVHFFSLLRKDTPILLAGDFNESDKGLALHYLRKMGYRDVLAQNRSFYTWHRKYPPLVIKRRLDHVFYKDPIRVLRVQALLEGGSDHYPLVVDFTRP